MQATSIRGFLLRADDVLRRRAWTTQSERPARALVALAGYIVLFGMIYGGAMGSFGGMLGERCWQIVFSSLKVPLLLLATFLISLPTFFVLNTLLGLRADFLQAVRALAATQAGLAIVLASLAPITILWYASADEYPAAVLFNACMFAMAALAGQFLLRGYYGPLIAKSGKHRWLVRIWVVLYAFVGIQMGWILRPFVGDPHAPVQFFREETWGNAYVVVAELIWRVLRMW